MVLSGTKNIRNYKEGKMIFSYAARILSKQGLQLYAGGRRILHNPYTQDYPPLRTLIEKGTQYLSEIVDENSIEVIKDLKEIEDRFAFKVLKDSSRKDFYSRQQFTYLIVKSNHPSPGVRLFTKDHYIEYHISKKMLRGVGRNFGLLGYSDWIPLEKPKIDTNKEVNILDLSAMQSMASKNMELMFTYSKKREFFDIPETVIGISNDGYIVTLPTPKVRNLPFICIYGSKGQGKTMLENSIEDGFFHKGKIKICNVNDLAPESHTRCLPWGSTDNYFVTELNRFGEKSIPKPCIYLHPTTKTAYKKIHYMESGFDISIPLKQVLMDENLLYFNPAWKMNESATGLDRKSVV